MPSPKMIGIGLVVAAAAGLVPGVPGLVGGGAPAEDQALADDAAALPTPPAVVPVSTAAPTGPDDGLIRLVVTPDGIAEGLLPEQPGDDGAQTTDPAVTACDASDDLPGADVAPEPEAIGDPTDVEIDPDVLAELTGGAILRFDRRDRPWAVFPDGTRIPLFGSGNGKDILAALAGTGDAPAPTPTASVAADLCGANDGTSGPTPAPVATAPATPAIEGTTGHPTMDLITRLRGVVSVTPLGDGSYAVVVEDAAVLDGLPVHTVEDIPMGIGGDPYEPYQWAIDNDGHNLDSVGDVPVVQVADADTDALEASQAATGAGVVVAVIDSGVDFSHPDLAPTQWTNPGETCGNGVDDDRNGYVDDCHGWDFAYGDAVPFNPGANPHGTHVAGIVAAARNGSGTVGVAPGARVMDLNVGTITASGAPGITMSSVALAIRYAAANGADVVNLSLGTPPGTPRNQTAAVEEAIRAAESAGVLVIAAAGNDDTNLDGAPSWPASYEFSNMVTVGATNPDDTKASFSNYGAVVDVFAPGHVILSTVPPAQGSFSFMSGTSQATPVVAGTAALFLESHPGATPASVRVALRGTSDVVSALAPFVNGGVRVNAANLVGLPQTAVGSDALTLTVSGLAGARSDRPVTSRFAIAVPTDEFADEFRWTLSLLAVDEVGPVGLVDHPISVGGTEVRTGDDGAVTTALGGSGLLDVSTSLPAGDYAYVLEAVPADDPTVRLGTPRVVRFSVVDGAAPDGAASTGPSDGTGSGSGSGESTTAATSPAVGSDGSGTASPGGVGGSATGGARGSTAGSSGVTGGSTSATGSGTASSGSPTSGGAGATATSTGSAGTQASSSTTTSTTTTSTTTTSGSSTSGAATDSSAGPPSGSGSGGGGGSAGSTSTRTVDGTSVPRPAPVTQGRWAVVAISPYYGPIGQQTQVTLWGSFPSEPYVWFGDRPGQVQVATETALVVLTPTMSVAGPVDISVRPAGSPQQLVIPGGFTVLDASVGPPDPAPAGSSTATGTSTGGAAPNAGTAGPAAGGSTGASGATGDAGGSTVGSGEAATSPAPATPTPTIDGRTRTSRTQYSGVVVDVGNGLRGVRLDDGTLVSGAPVCRTDPCRY